jgi:hypothetical protein
MIDSGFGGPGSGVVAIGRDAGGEQAWPWWRGRPSLIKHRTSREGSLNVVAMLDIAARAAQ